MKKKEKNFRPSPSVPPSGGVMYLVLCARNAYFAIFGST